MAETSPAAPEILAFRRRYFAALSQLIAPGTDPVEGIASGFDLPNFNRELVEIVRWAAYEFILPAAGHLAIL